MGVLSTSIMLALSAVSAPPAKSELTFNAHIRPIFKAYCFDCHGEEAKPKGELDLRLVRFAKKGGTTGPAILPGKSSESLLMKRIHDDEMPPGKKKLSKAEKDLISRWIATGAKTEIEEPEKLAAGIHISELDKKYWFFQPIVKPKVPDSNGKTGVDAFIEAKLKEHKLSLQASADKRTLLRRVTFDLTGLPPTPEELQQFLADDKPGSYERVINRLLASPRYGERWARHWLDVAGYADSEGGSPLDPVRANAWMYRDYLIKSFNADKPFNRMIVEQLAGDELVPMPYAKLTPEQQELLIATGFLRTATDGTGAVGADQKLTRNQVLTDTVKVVSSSFLGLTVGCAECHNHRYDPIPQSDFYRLRAILDPSYDVTNWKAPGSRQVSMFTAQDKKLAAEIEAKAVKLDAERLKKQEEFINATLEKEYAKLPESLREDARKARNTIEAKRTAAQKKIMQENPSLNVSAGSLYLYDSKAAAELTKMTNEATALRATKPVDMTIRALFETPGIVPVTKLLHRGDPDQPKEGIEPGGLTVLDTLIPLKISKSANGTTGRRMALANWLIDAKNPMTSRVFVNRIWMHYFGKGLVGTPGDFGRLGEAPTHPELLDWLASEFMAHDWSLKHLHRTIVMSETYRQSSQTSEQTRAIDPANTYLSRFPMRRLDAEAIRDSMLSIAGTLNDKMFGPPVPVRENEVGAFVLGIENKDGAGRFTAEKPLPVGEEYRRSVYVQVRRTRPLADLDVFDWAVPEPNCELRKTSTVTPQALMLLNNETITKHAQQFAKRLIKDAKTPELQVKRAWHLVYQAEPTSKELSDALAFLKEVGKPVDPKVKDAPEERALAIFCQALFCSNRYLYLD